MAYLSSGASQIINARQYKHSGNNGIAARASNLEMRPSWDSSINHRISKQQLNLWAIAGVKKKKLVNKIVAKGVAENAMSNNILQSKYDVYVSFRGEDIRQGFLGHLIKAFSQKQINVFVDNKLKMGDDISHLLVEAIEGSYISLIVFSENYASSPWCLEELVQIIECKEKYGKIVIPVFYGVDPTNVRHQSKSYESAFAELEKRYNPSQIQTWRRALNIAANLSGISSPNFRNDAELLEDIINLVSERLSTCTSFVKVDGEMEVIEELDIKETE